MAATLSDILPAPTRVSEDWTERESWLQQPQTQSVAVIRREPPPYGSRSGYIPRVSDDYGDGGSFPEIHMAQYPLLMGKDSQQGGSKSKTLAVQLDAEGKIRYDAIARIGHGKDKIIFSKLSDLKPKLIDEDDDGLKKPDEEETRALTESTREALERLTQAKVAAAMPVKRADKLGPAQYIRYTPSQQGSSFNSGAQQRIIRMVEVQQDPMEPPRFKINQKLPRPPPSPPAPVLHSPTRKVSVKDQQDWKIPPCISNWKNAKGYTIPLDKRLAADGRGLQQVHINENFSKLAEALYIADRKAREAVELRATMEKKLAQKQKEEKEEKMRDMARKAREERAGLKTTLKQESGDDLKERDEIRHDRHQERRRDKNISRAAPEVRAKLKKDKDRDISEKIALGLPDARGSNSETQFDQRLFNVTKGLDSGGGMDDDSYAVYDKPWRTSETVAKSIYRPGKNLDAEVYGDDLEKIINTNRFVPDKGFSGADKAVRREGPVQFEKQEEEDPFGLGKFLDEAKKGHKRGGDDAEKDRSERDSSKRRK